ncbi:MAG: RidA family protein [Nitrospinota bacterium]
MEKKIITTAKAPAAIGPYSQAVKAGDTIFLSGQIALDPQSGEMVEGGVKEQTGRVIKNLEAVLGEAGATLNNVVKTTVYLSDLSHFAEMNEVYESYFASGKPARATVQAAALPKGALVEIDAIAVL